MFKKKLLFLLMSVSFVEAHKQAIIIMAVLEMNNSFPAPSNPSASAQTGRCNRSHQGLFNEYVNVVEEKDLYAKIFYDNVTYAIAEGTLSTFWTYKDGITVLDSIENADMMSALPHPVYGQESTIVLVYPWHNFSVGTRLRHLPAYDNATGYAVLWLDHNQKTVLFGHVPYDDALSEIQQDAQSKRGLFVGIVNTFIDRVESSGVHQVIPYVWGGSSFLHSYNAAAFYEQDGVWQRDGNNNPYTGYDCSEFTMRMAQIAGIDFPWKTTIAIKHGRPALDYGEFPQEGDLIWVQGHVMIISNLERNEVIEARGYASGYGRVHRINLADLFVGVTTYDDLVARYYAQQPVQFKNKAGEAIGNQYAFALLKLV